MNKTEVKKENPKSKSENILDKIFVTLVKSSSSEDDHIMMSMEITVNS